MSNTKALNLIEIKQEKDGQNNQTITTQSVNLVGEEEIEFILRFKKEIGIVDNFEHPCIPKLYSCLQHEDYIEIITKKPDTIPLNNFLFSEPSFETRLELFIQFADALSYIHENNIIHRSLKPSNIEITTDENPKIVILNTGLHYLCQALRIPLKIEDFLCISPEQTGILKRKVDIRSDLYSAGVIGYYILTNNFPFPGADISSIVHQHIAKSPEKPSQVDKSLPSIFDSILLKLLSKNPQFRYQSAKALKEDLERFKSLNEKGKGKAAFQIAESDTNIIDFHTRLIGRENEIKQLNIALERARFRKGSILLIEGADGSGKTRLIWEFKDIILKESGMFLSTTCTELKKNMPYRPLIDIFNIFAMKILKYSDEKKEIKVKELNSILGDYKHVFTGLSGGFKKLLGESEYKKNIRLDREVNPLFEIFANLLLSMASKKEPLIIFMDDLQYCDEGTLSFLDFFAKQLAELNILIIGAYKTLEENIQYNFKNRLPSSIFIQLKPLNKEQIRTLINELFHNSLKDYKSLADKIFDEYNGNPFVIIEIIKNLVNSNHIVAEKNSYKIKNINDYEFPKDIFNWIVDKIKDLSDDAYSLFKLASILNQEFTIELLKNLLKGKIDYDNILASIDEGINKGIIWDTSGGEGIYNFIHEKLRNTLYNSIPDNEKIKLHLTSAKYFEKALSLHTGENIFVIAYHYLRTKNKKKSLEYLEASAQRAEEIYSYYETAIYLEEAIELIKKLKKTDDNIRKRIELLLKYVKVTIHFGQVDENITRMMNALTLAEEEGYENYRIKVMITLGRLYFFKGDDKESLRWFNNALQLSGQVQDKYSTGVIYKYLGLNSIFLDVDFSKAIRFLEKALASFNNDEIIDNIEAMSFLAFSYVELGNFTKATDHIEKALYLIKTKDDPIKLSYVYHYASIVYNIKGNFDLALQYSTKAHKLAEKNYDKLIEYSSCNQIAVSYYNLEEYSKGIASAEKALDIAMHHEVRVGLGYVYNILAACYIHINPEKSIQILNRGIPIAKYIHDNNTLQQAYRCLGMAYRMLRQFDKAVEFGKKSIEYSKKLMLNPDTARNVFEYGVTLKSMGLQEESLQNTNTAIDMFSKIGMVWDLERANKILESDRKTDIQLHKEAIKDKIEFSTVLKINKMISSILDIDKLLEKLIDTLLEVVGAHSGFIMLYENDTLTMKTMRNVSKEVTNMLHLRLSEAMIMYVEKNQTPVLLLKNNLQEYIDITGLSNIPSAMCVPFIVKNQMIGLIYLENEYISGLFTEQDLEMMNEISFQAATAIDNALKYDKLNKENANLKKDIINKSNELKLAGEYMDGILNASPISILITDEQGIINFINPSMERMLGSDFTGCNIFSEDILKANMTNSYSQALEGMGNALEMIKYYSPENEEYILNCLFMPIYSNDNTINAILILFVDITDKAIAQEELDRTNTELSRLNDIAKAVNSSLDLDYVLESTLQELKDIFQIDGMIIYLYDSENNTINFKKGSFPNNYVFKLTDQPISLSGQFNRIAKVIEKGLSLYSERVPNILRDYFPYSVKTSYFTPIRVKGEVIGLLHLFSTEKKFSMEESESVYLTSFITQIATAINNSMLYEKLSRAMKDLAEVHVKLKEQTDLLTEDLQIARKVQRAILPSDFSDLTELSLYLRYFPLQHVGGDIYDIFRMDNGIIRIFLCDATGHGVQAALTTMTIKTLYEAYKKTFDDPSKLLSRVNDEYSEKFDLGNYFTAIILDIDFSSSTLTYSNGGHPFPILVSDTECKPLEGRDMLIGIHIMDDAYKAHTVKLTQNSKVFIFTDGLFEEFNENDEQYSEKRVIDFLYKNRNLPLGELGDNLIADVHNFISHNPLTDDLCLIGFKIIVE